MMLDLALSLIQEKIIVTLVKMVRKTLFRTTCDRCQDYHNRGERFGPTLNTKFIWGL